MKANQQSRCSSSDLTDRAEVRGRRRKRLPDEMKPGRFLSQNPDYEAILAAIAQETEGKEPDIT